MAEMNESLVIELKNVSTIYEGEQRPAINDVSLSIEENELLYVIGPNASGKTTLLETINGLLPIIKGKITVLGVDVRNEGRKVRRKIGYVPQDFMVEPGEPYKAIDVVAMGRYGMIGAIHKPKTSDREKAFEAMRMLKIEELAQRPMGKLSGGQQQKVMIARVLAKEPAILLLDEPFSNLDPESRETIPNMLSNIHKEKNLTTVVVTHDVGNILKKCRRVVAMSSGRIVADTSPKEISRKLEATL